MVDQLRASLTAAQRALLDARALLDTIAMAEASNVLPGDQTMAEVQLLLDELVLTATAGDLDGWRPTGFVTTVTDLDEG